MSSSDLFDESEMNARLKLYYPSVDQEQTPIPRRWNPKDKYNFIQLSPDNLKVQYKGQGKTHRDAASVRATHPIPLACGIYYFEVTIVSKGRDGYMGVGLSAQTVNLNRLPGWDKHSYGYHGDDGHSFCATGTGQPYGPKFTTGDVIGCCLNMVDNSCFYTKNGVNLGTAFRDLPVLPLFPTVGLQTPKEEIIVNFGQHPFLFDLEDCLKEWKRKTLMSVDNYVIQDDCGQFQSILQKLVSSYLIHHGYVSSAEAFNKSINQGMEAFEDITSIRNRQKIQKLVLTGRIGEAIETTDQLFPGILAKNKNLLFLLKVRQFIEMVNGTNSEISNLIRNTGGLSKYSSPVMSPKNVTWNKSASNSPISSHNGFSSPTSRASGAQQFRVSEPKPFASNPTGNAYHASQLEKMEYSSKAASSSSSEGDSDMETDSDDGVHVKGEPSNGVVSNGFATHNAYNHDSENVTGECPSSHKHLCGGNQLAMERMMQFGQHLLTLSKELTSEDAKPVNKKILNDAYSLLAYTDPWNSPVGFQLDPIQREPICAALNSQILESQNLPKRPPLLSVVGQTQQCMRKMLVSSIGAAAFVSLSDYLR